MNAAEKRWVNKWLHKIWVIQDSQEENINNFLIELSKRTGFQRIKESNERIVK